jgi:predicted transcriptional regulator
MDQMNQMKERLALQAKLKRSIEEMVSEGVKEQEIFDALARSIFSFLGGEGPERKAELMQWLDAMAQHWFVDALVDDDDPPRPPLRSVT